MESRVLLPQELVLTVRTSGECSSPSVARLLEHRVGVAARDVIEKGTIFASASGTVRCGRLEVYSTISSNDVRNSLGSFDEIVEDPISSIRYRRCNWIRFLSTSDDFRKCNLRCFLDSHGSHRFETSERIDSNTELILYYPNSISPTKMSSPIIRNTIHDAAIRTFMMETALDLSIPLLSFLDDTFHSEDRKSVTSDSGISSGEEFEQLSTTMTTMTAIKTTTATATMAAAAAAEEATTTAETRTTTTTTTTPTTLSSPSLIRSDFSKSRTESKSNCSPVTASPTKRNKKMLPCSFCGKCFDRPSLLNRHLRTHTGERPHVCDVCDKGFSTSSSLNTHRRIHSGEKPHECATCGKRFTASSNLYYHRMTHVKEKPHKCELCQKSFPTPGDLKSHMYIHNGSWPHRCHICDRGFSKVTNLKNHLFLHTGEKPHVCPVCGKRFALGCNMKAHLKTHHDSMEQHS